MSNIQPKDPRLLTDRDVNYEPFHCCGDEDLVFIKCARCAHLMVFCYECDTLYPDLTDTTKQQQMPHTRESDRLICPNCNQPFPDFYFLMQPYVDKYLVTAEEVMSRGFGHLLAEHRRGSKSS
jgi:hypothetical protein